MTTRTHIREGITLDELFDFADLDDVSVIHDGESQRIRFTVRESGEQFAVEEETLEEALEQTRLIINRQLRLIDLRNEGLTDEDIDRLVAAEEEAARNNYFDDTAEAWDRGYEAGHIDAASLFERALDQGFDVGYERGVEDAVRNQRTFDAAAASAPVQPAAAEPFDGARLMSNPLAQHPLITVLYQPVMMFQHDQILSGQEAALERTQD